MSADKPIRQANDPIAAARRLARRELPKRFYKTVEIIEEDRRFNLRLDGRPALTPGRNRLTVTDRNLADALCMEWQAQDEHIDPAAMPVTRLVNTALDGVPGNEEAICGDIVAYAGSDLLCYRAGEPQGLVDRQRALWDPVLAWAEQLLEVRFRLAEGVVHVTQPREVRIAMKLKLAVYSDPFRLAGLSLATNLTGSALLALAAAEGFLTPDEAWRAAHVDEDWNIAQWGEDEQAAARRADRYSDFIAAMIALGRANGP
ncbi:MAG TPA: ATP12 family protein [Afifellaceae bacterium]|nr:ATP12 family protein [Afifellaceae bacterium]